MNVLSFVEQQHCAEIADAFVGKPWRRYELEALELTKVCRITVKERES